MERRTLASRRIANVLLSVVLVLGLMPAPAFAEGAGGSDAAGPAVTATQGGQGDSSAAAGHSSDARADSPDTQQGAAVIGADDSNGGEGLPEAGVASASMEPDATAGALDIDAAPASDGSSALSEGGASLTPGWTRSGTCEWKIDENGQLTVRPLGDGASGVLADWGSSNYDLAPWYYQRESIKSAVIEPGVSAKTCRLMFYGCHNLTTLDLSGLDTSNVTDMGGMFNGCSSLSSLDLSGLDTSAVTGMGSMFYGCSRLTTLDLSSFDTSQVTDMYSMFYGCSSLSSLDLSSFDTSKVTGMGWMFYGCKSLASLDLSSFDTSKVTSMREMFDGCSSLTTLDLSSFDTSAVTSMYYMFCHCSSLATIYASFGFDTGAVEDSFNMFGGCGALSGGNGTTLSSGYVDDKNCAKVDGYDGPGYFTLREGLTPGWKLCGTCEWAIDGDGLLAVRPLGDGASGELADWGSSDAPWYSRRGSIRSAVIKPGVRAKTCYRMFGICYDLTSLDLSGLNTSKVTDMGSMFYACSKLTTLDLSSFDTSQVTGMSGMFEGCSSLSSLDLSSFDTSKVTGMGSMFERCSSLSFLDLSSFDTSAVTDMGSMFYGCSSLISLDLSSFDTSAVTRMGSMFRGCSSLISLDLSSFDTSAVTDMGSMFYGCSKLTTLDLSSFDFGKVADFDYFAPNYTPVTVRDAESYRILANEASMGYITVKDVAPSDETWSVWNTCEWKVANGTLVIRPAGGAVSGMLGYPFQQSSKYVDGGYVYYYAPWCQQAEDIKSVTIEPGIAACDSVANLFNNHTNLASADLSGLDFSTVKKMSKMFYGCASLKEIPAGFEMLANIPASQCFYVPNSTEMRYTGADAAITAYDWASDNRVLAPAAAKGWSRFGGVQWQVANGTLTIAPLPGEGGGEMGSLDVYTGVPWYAQRKDITSVKIEGDIKAGVSLGYAFDGMANLVSADLSNLDVSATTDMSCVFHGCSSLAAVDLSGWVTPSLENACMAFSKCASLQSVNLIGWDFSHVTDMRQMFAYCPELAMVPAGLTIPDGAESGKLFYVDQKAPIDYDGSDKSILGYDWKSDNRIAAWVCAGEHTWGEGVVTKEPTCTEPGEETLTCTACGATLVGSYIAPTGHAWGEPAIVFSEDGRSAVATWTCGNDAAHTETADCAVTSEATKAATCTEVGETTYTATAASEGMPSGTAQKTLADVPAKGHRFESYASDGNATCEADGTETAACANGCGATDTRIAKGSALGHDWLAPAIAFSEDGRSAYAIWACGNDASHMRAATCAVASSVAPATCEDAETTTYTATVTADGMPFGTSSTTRVTAPAKGHAWGEWQVETAATCEAAGTERRTCANDGSHAEERAIPATGHAWGEPVVEFSDDMASATATWTCTNDASHRHVETCKVTKREKLAASCFAHGENVYVATAACAGAASFAFEATVENTPARGHHFEGMVCADCGTHLGDVNGNGVVNVVDAQIAYDIAIGKGDYSDLPGYKAYRAAADVTGTAGSPDGELDASNAFRIQYVALHGWE